MHARVAAALLGVLLVGCGAQTVGRSFSASASDRAAATVEAPEGAGASASAATIGLAADPARIRETLETLQQIADANGGVRAVGTPGFEASVDAMATELEGLGFSVETPAVEFTGFAERPGARLEVGARTFEAPDELHALIYSAGGHVDGPVAELDESGCEADHFAGIPAGAIVLTTRGGCFRRDQAINAIEAGAVALVVGYPGRGPGEIYRPTLIDPSQITIPVVSVTDDAVRALGEFQGERAKLVVDTEREPATLRNVIGQLGEGSRVVMLGAHLDSVLEGPGINDNGSGVAALLEVARGAAEVGVPDGWALRIGLWGGEEFGTVGSRAYAEEIDDEVVAYLNIDMAGSINGATLVYDEDGAAPGSQRITRAYEAWLDARGEPAERVDIGGSSDHFGFIRAGIPTGGLFAGAGPTGSAAAPSAPGAGEAPDPCYHLACDDIGNVDIERVSLFAEATFHVAYELME